MSLNVAHPLPTKSVEVIAGAEVRKTKRQLAGARKNKQQRDNIENSPSLTSTSPAVSLANLPIQKQSTKVRKRLLTESQLPNASANDNLSTKRHKVLLDDPRPPTPVLTAVPSTLNVTPLHRTLSDKSSYLNQATVSESSTPSKDPSSFKSQSTLSSWRKSPLPKRSGSESEDADDEDDVPARSPITPQLPNSTTVVADLTPTTPNGPRLGLIDFAFGQSSPTKTPALPSYDDDLFGSDTTLTSPEDDSEDEHGRDESVLSNSAKPSEEQPVVASTQAGASTALSSPHTLLSNDSAATTMPGTSPSKRRGRPRKNSSPFIADSATSAPKGSDKSEGGTSTWSSKLLAVASLPKQASLADIWPSTTPVKLLTLLTTSARTEHGSSTGTTLSGSLMARVIEGKKKLSQPVDDDDADLADSSDDTDLAPMLRALVQSKIGSPQALLEAHNQIPTDVLDKPHVVAVVPDLELEREIASATDQLALSSLQSPTKVKEHVFATPMRPVPRSARGRPPGSKSKGTFARRSIEKQSESFPILHSMPRPRLFKTCLEIMTQSDPVRHQTDIQSIKLMLKHALQQGMRRMSKFTDVNQQVPTYAAELKMTSGPATASIQMQAWGCVVGNGKGLFKEPTRKQEELDRVAERRFMIADAYRALNFPPPPQNWDKSSSRALASANGDFSSETTEATGAQASHATDDVLDTLSRRLGCEYCRKTYKNKNGLVYHMERCKMAKLQTSIVTDLDGDSTTSESEDQRVTRYPKATKETSASNDYDGESSNDEYGEEGVIMCVCGSKEDEGSMIQCDDCKVWLHIDCLNLTEEDIPEEFFCPPCLGQPVPSTGGKSFRSSPTKVSKRKADYRPQERPRRRSRSEASASDSGDDRNNCLSETSARDYTSNGFESGSDDPESAADGLVSPQVVLNHDWDESHGDPSSDLAYDSEFMSPLYGPKSTRTIFRQSRAPALMLDGSSSQESQADAPNSLLSSDIGFDDESGIIFQAVGGAGLSGMGVELSSDADRSLHGSQSFDFMSSSADPLFEPEYGSVDEAHSDLLLLSEETIDSEGLQTPIDVHHGGDLWVSRDLESFVEERVAGYDLECASTFRADIKGGDFALDWLCEPDIAHSDDFDLNGLIDLEAVTISDN